MRRDVQDIFRATPTQKQVMMFSATLAHEIRPVCKKFMQNPLEIYVDDETKLTLHGLQQYFIKLDEKEKNRKLNELLDELQFNQAIIFVKSTARATELDKLLQSCNFPSVAVHSGVSQEERYVISLYLQKLNSDNYIVYGATKHSKIFRSVFVSQLISSAVGLILSESILLLIMTYLLIRAHTFTVLVVPADSVLKDCLSHS